MAKGASRRHSTDAERERLSRQTLVTAALRMADDEGLRAVTVRRLAADLSVSPMALYWHFRDKNLLLDAVTEHVLSLIEVPSYRGRERPAWDDQLLDLFGVMVAELRKHSALAPLVHRRLMQCTPGFAIGEACFAALHDAGFSEGEFPFIGTHAMNGVIALVTMRPVAHESPRHPNGTRPPGRDERPHATDPEPEAFPHVSVSAAVLLSAPTDQDEWYASGIRLLVGGIRSLRHP